MKVVILITVIESSIVMLAILYFYYRRSQSRKRALVFRRPNVSITEQAQAKVVLPPSEYSHRSLPEQSGQAMSQTD
jgi:Flp pilus assembly protein TadB